MWSLCLQTLTDHPPYLDICQSYAANCSHTFVCYLQLSWDWFIYFFTFCLSAGRQAGSQTDRHTHAEIQLCTLSAPRVQIDTSFCHQWSYSVIKRVHERQSALRIVCVRTLCRGCQVNAPFPTRVINAVKITCSPDNVGDQKLIWKLTCCIFIYISVLADNKRPLLWTIIAHWGDIGIAQIFLMTDAVWAWLWWSS